MSKTREAYLAEIKEKRDKIQEIVSRKFSQYPCEVRGGHDDMEVAYIILYCVRREDFPNVENELDELIEDMSTIAEYLMLISNLKTPEVTKEYYPEFYEKWEKLGTR